MQKAQEKQRKALPKRTSISQLGTAPTADILFSLHAKVFATTWIENQPDKPECPRVKMTHPADLNNTNGEAQKHDFHFF